MSRSALGAMFIDGTLRVPIERRYPLEDLQAALAHAARGGRRGKILLDLRPDQRRDG